MTKPKIENRVRVGVFSTVAAAERAVNGLLDAGFPTSAISVVCSDQAKESHFRAFEHDMPAGSHTPATAAKGGLVGALGGGLIAAASVVATGGLSLVVIGPVFLGIGATVGTFIGAMTSRGVEREVANYYDQALRRGNLLVAAEVAPDGDPELLARAERVLSAAGAEPIELPAG